MTFWNLMFLMVHVLKFVVGRSVSLLNSVLPNMEAARPTRVHGVADVRYVRWMRYTDLLYFSLALLTIQLLCVSPHLF